jgi:nucleoside-diphosphate-sugar epimerase
VRSLVIGGTRNLGPAIVQALLQRGDNVAVFNRGRTPDDLPAEVERLRGDRTDSRQLKQLLSGRNFDLVVDTTLYTGREAEAVVEIFADRIGRYVFLSTGQVYLVRIGLERPYKEEDYPGPVMPAPPRDDPQYESWLYGVDKRAAEDVFMRAWKERKFPFTSLRLPMVNSERDHYDRIYGYFLRLKDGGPILIPEGAGLPLRHVYGQDVARAIAQLTVNDLGKGGAYNLSQDETISLPEFLEMLSGMMRSPLRIVRVPREMLEQEHLLPDCSPFSGRWMSSLDNRRSKEALGIVYTPLRTYLRNLIDHFEAAPQRGIEGYKQRPRELDFAKFSK